MDSDFADLNAYVYHSARALVFDGLIWCLRPYIDEQPRYGYLRLLLACCTRGVVRSWLKLISPPVRPQGGRV